MVRAIFFLRYATVTKIAWEDAGTGTRHSNVYLSVRDKQGIVVYRQRVLVLQTVTSLGVVSLVFRGHDLLKIANFNP